MITFNIHIKTYEKTTQCNQFKKYFFFYNSIFTNIKK